MVSKELLKIDIVCFVLLVLNLIPFCQGGVRIMIVSFVCVHSSHRSVLSHRPFALIQLCRFHHVNAVTKPSNPRLGRLPDVNRVTGLCLADVFGELRLLLNFGRLDPHNARRTIHVKAILLVFCVQVLY